MTNNGHHIHMPTDTNKPPMKPLGCIWNKVSKSQTKYLTGVFSMKKLCAALGVNSLAGLEDKDINFIVFSNTRKESPTQPDMNVYFSEPRAPQAAAPAKPAFKKPAPAKPVPQEEDGLI